MTTPISMWLTIEIVTFYAFIAAAILFLMYTRIFIKKYDAIDFRKKDIIEENFYIVQYIANYVSVISVCVYLIILETEREGCP